METETKTVPLEDVQVGDLVLLDVQCGFKSFRVSAKVEKATKTQITVKGNRYNRNRGIMIGSSGWNSNFVYEYKKEYDRTAEYKEYIARHNGIWSAEKIAKHPKRMEISIADAKLLEEIYARIQEIGNGN